MLTKMKRTLRSLLLASSCLMIGTLALAAHADSVSDVEEVTEVVVTAAGFQQKIEQAPASISVLSRDELASERHQSLAEALANVEGVDVGNSAGKTGGLNISIRGMGNDYTLVLVDGRRQNPAGSVTPNGFGETASSFIPPMSAIDRIEVVRGPVSTLYGSDAMGGVVNIITRKVGTRWGGSVNINSTVQSDDQFGNIYGGSVYANGPLIQDKLGLALRGSYQTREEASLSYERADGTTANVSTRGESPVENKIWSAGGRLSFTPSENHDILLDYDVNKQWYDNSKGQLGEVGVRGYAKEQEFENQEAILGHNWRLGFGELQSTLSYGKRETIGRILPDDVPGTDRKKGDPRTLEATNIIFDTKFFSNWRNHTFTVGGQYWDAEMVDGVAPAPYEHQQWALFAEDEWRFTDTLALTIGARLDDHSVFGQHTSPRAYLVWNATNNWTLKGGISQGFKTPLLDWIAPGITGFGGQGTSPNIGTPTLKPETSTSTEFAIFYDNRSDFRANLTFFHNKFEDKIVTSTDRLLSCAYNLTRAQYEAGERTPNCNADYGWWPGSFYVGRPVEPSDVSMHQYFTQRVNVGEVETQGIEGAFRYLIGEGWSLSGNYTYTTSEEKDTATGENVRYQNTPRHMLNGSVRYQATDNLNLWLRGEYRSKRYRSEDSATSFAKATYGDYRAYGLFHVGGSYKFNDKVSLNAAIYNLFDKDFVSYGPYKTLNNNGVASTAYTRIYANNQEPRRLWLSLTTEF